MMLKNTKKKEEEGAEKLKLNNGVELMLQRRRAPSSKFNLGNPIQGKNVLAIALTFGTLVAVLFLFVGGIIGWLYKQHQQKTDISEMHPEMYDLKGNVIPDEIIAFRFENVNFDSEIDEEL